MAPPLEHKRRVRVPEGLELPEPRQRRSLTVPLASVLWLGSVALAVGISEGAVPIERWLAVEPDRGPRVVLPPIPRNEAPPPRRDTPPPPTFAAAAMQSSPPAAAEGAAPEPDDAPATRTAADPTELPEPSEPPEPAPAIATAEPAAPDEPEAREQPARVSAATGGKSCEQAQAEAVTEIVVGKDRGPADLSREDFARVLDRGDWFNHCGAPSALRIEVCAAVQRGRAVGVTVRTIPGDPSVSRCIARAAWGLAFPSSPRLDVARTVFED